MSTVNEAVALAIQAHQVEVATDWSHHDLVQELHTWVRRYNTDFALGVPTPVIAVAPLRREVLAQYRLGHSDIGARTTITFNERWLAKRPFADTLVTLLHELVHAHEEWICGRRCGGWYHTTAWRAKMAEIGVIADDHGRSQRVLPVFSRYLARYGVAEFRPPAPAEAPQRRRAMPKWACACPSGNPARAIYLHAVCRDCGRPYRRVELE